MEVEADIDLSTQEVLLAAAHHDLTKLRALLRNTSANVQDGETGFTPLHAAIAACEPEERKQEQQNGDVDVSSEQQETVADAERTLKLLLQNGAIWNDLDVRNETPGCLALRFGLRSLYEVMVDAGVRAELLLNRLDDYEPLVEEEDDEEDKDEDKEENVDVEGTEEVIGANELITDELMNDEPSPIPNAPNFSLTNTTEGANDDSTNSANYLTSSLQFHPSRLLDSSHNGVMMSWETSIMRRTADLLLPTSSLSVLNIGHGMGIIDGFLQAKAPTAHHIVEAHPQVLQQMRRTGWFDRPGVTVHKGRWQDVLPRLVQQGAVFDAIYFDTFAEDYKAFRNFFSEYVIGLLSPEKGLWGFFHGLGADRQISYDVYTKVVEMDLFEAGYDVEWETMEVPDLEQSEEWEGVRRRYWALDRYRLPICRFVG